ncbi:non-ribosomal peptide synthetase [Pedobacter steynii]|uniref:Carrier domain-containing protein n=1 Tax=Pedobacter steynii TaxID=430522 RepID=A0A1D7QJA5_9SPHI|nr:non-ribosomal peptide synthetase [Pedobacter steynii]AOM78756.1 hypothetical protein BFS30_17185 [Pedobacter steynii]
MSDKSKLNIKAIEANRNIGARYYWEARLDGFESESYFSNPDPISKLNHSGQHECLLSVPLNVLAELDKVAPSAKSKHVVFLSILTVLGYKFSGKDDVCILTPFYKAEIAEMTNEVIPFRSSDFSQLKFLELLIHTKSTLLKDLHQGNYPIEKMFRQGYDLQSEPSIGLLVEGLHTAQAFQGLNPDLLFSFHISDQLLKIKYNSKQYTLSYIEYIGNCFLNLLSKVLLNIHIPIREIEAITEEEKEQILYTANVIESTISNHTTVISLFRNQAQRTPQHIAFSAGDQICTYQELDQWSDKIAGYLNQNYDIKKGDRVGLFLAHEAWLIPVILGVLKAGGVYVPVDPAYPIPKIKAITNEADLKLVIARGGDVADLSDTVILDLDIHEQLIQTFSFENSLSIPGSEDLAYIIFTSGSTGKPKGVVIQHSSLLNYISWASDFYIGSSKATFPLYTSISFDLTITSIFTPLISGNKIIVYQDAGPELINALFVDDEIDIIKLTPSHLNIVRHLDPVSCEHSKKNKKLIVGGEELSSQLAAEIYLQFDKQIDIYNEYGPTEATVGCMIYKYDPLDQSFSVPIGYPIRNTAVYLLDSNFNHVPAGSIGELYIAGEGLAAGYFRQEELSNQKFIDNPFVPELKMYKTGDLAIRDLANRIVFRGRTDEQFKIRGYRIEPAEIERSLLQFEGVNQALVTVMMREGEKYLVAYYTAENEIFSLREYLLGILPAYMVPSYYVWLSVFPLSANGKIDKKLLPEAGPDQKQNFQEPRTAGEKELAQIWAEILHLDAEKISVNRSFFELGGHSLKAVNLMNRIRKQLGTEVPLKEIFNCDTISSLSVYINDIAIRSTQAAIQVSANHSFYRLSSAQQRLYFLYELDKDSLAYNMPQLVRISGGVDREKLINVFCTLISRHESLRTSFVQVDGRVFQTIGDGSDFQVEEYTAVESDLNEVINQFIRPFELDSAPLIRVGLVSVSKDEDVLLVDMHHIITDGVSQDLLIRDFIKLYRGEELPVLRLQYKDYSEWQQSEEEKVHITQQKDFWLAEYEELPEVLDLPVDYARPKQRSYKGDSYTFEISAQTTNALRELASREGATLYMVLLSVYNIFLGHLSGKEDIVVGSPVAGRRHADLEDIIGMFVNTLALRNYPKGGLNFREFLGDLRSGTLSCLDHQDFQYEELVEELKLTREMNRNPLFDVIFSYENFSTEVLDISGLTMTPYNHQERSSKFDLTLAVREGLESLSFAFNYSTDLFTTERIVRFGVYLEHIIEMILENPDIRLSDIKLSGEDEEAFLLALGQGAVRSYSEDQTVVHLFAEQVVSRPDAIALTFNDHHISYVELHKKSDYIANLLKEQGVKKGTLVPVFTERSSALIIGILGILKAGGAYVPIDPEYPESRVTFMLNDLNAKVILAGATFKSEEDLIVLDLNKLLENYAPSSDSFLRESVGGGDVAYINYTSGSTGYPKGVMVPHRAILRLLDLENIIFSRDTVTLQLSSASFDAATFEIWPALLSGGRIVIYSEKHVDVKKINQLISKQQINTLWLTSGLLDQWVDSNIEDLPLKYLLSGGDVVHASSVVKVYAALPGVTVYNGYGPTENTTFTCCHKIPRDIRGDQHIPIGRPVSGTSVYILNKYQRLSPYGTVGELCISGIGLSHGYINNQVLTDEKFILNPYLDGALMYRTGDLARWSANGFIEFLGRTDDQVKIRGYRIEPREIEKNLLQLGGVKQVLVVLKEGEADKYLVAYYVAEVEIEDASIRKFLLEILPDYMIPTGFVYLDSFPLTVNGKIDRRSLPEVVFSKGKYEGPVTTTEQQLMKIWSEVLPLNIEEIDIRSSFFDLGGHSLKAVSVVNQIWKEMEVEVPLSAIFGYQDIRSLCAYINDSARHSGYTEISASTRHSFYHLSSAQQRLYFLHELDKHSIAYNMPHLIRISGKTDRTKVSATFALLIARHESLRTNFIWKDGEAFQVIGDGSNFSMEEYNAIESELNGIINRFIRPFDLSEGSLIRAGLVSISEGEELLMIDMHHIINDGISQDILIRDFMKLYKDEKLPSLRLQYKDYSEWQLSDKERLRISQQKKFWLEEYQDLPEVMDLPSDFVRPKKRNHQGGVYAFELNEQTTQDLRDLGAEEGATLFMVLLSAFNVLLGRLGNREDIVVGSPVAGRRHADLEGLIGMFVNTLALRNSPAGSLSFREFLRNLRSRTLSCFEHQDFQYEDLVEELKLTRDVSRNPLFEVMFSYGNFDNERLEIPGLTLSAYNYKEHSSKFDLSLSVVETPERLYLSFDYATDLFTAERIGSFAEYLLQIINTVISNPDILLGDISLLGEKEQQYLTMLGQGTSKVYSEKRTIIDLFAEQVKMVPDAVAVVFKEKQLSYRELDEKANALSELIKNSGVKSGERIGVLIDHSLELLISFLAIMKSACTFVPIDVHWPLSRQNQSIALTTAAMVLCQDDIEGLEAPLSLKVRHEELLNTSGTKRVILSMEDPMYIIFTSGSTGIPKGVEVPYKGIMNRLFWMNDFFGHSTATSVLQTTRYVYDSMVWQLFWPLINGGKTIILPPHFEMSCENICKLIRLHDIKLVDFAPSVFNTVFEYSKNPEYEISSQLASLRYIIQGGEEISVKFTHQFLLDYPSISIVNLYGPTEASIGCIYHLVNPDGMGKIPIGKPINNVRVRITDRYGNLVPQGVSGEIRLSGVCLATGYFNNKKQTEERFVNTSEKGLREYLTGDLARQDKDGNIEFLGRIDDQVKIRGHRIEPGEIAGRLLELSAIREAIIQVKENEGDKYLVAFYVAETAIPIQILQTYLHELLPAYMVPSYYVHLTEFPLTANGKVNRKALPEPKLINDDEINIKAVDQTEKDLVKIWAEVLKTREENIGVNRNFFDLGGNSLKLIGLVGKINQHFNASLSVASLFELSTIRLQAGRIHQVKEIDQDAEEENLSASELESMVSLFNTDEGD